MADFRLTIITQQQKVFEGKVHSLVLPGEDGYLGIMARHAAIISILREGTVKITREGGIVSECEITGGFIEMRDNQATLMVDSLTGLEAQQAS